MRYVFIYTKKCLTYIAYCAIIVNRKKRGITMEKIDIARKLKREYTEELNVLYNMLKKEDTSDSEKNNIRKEITFNREILDTLKKLCVAYDNGNFDTYLDELTNENNDEYNNFINIYRNGYPLECEDKYKKLNRYKEVFDMINMIYLDKETIFEYLYDYVGVFKVASDTDWYCDELFNAFLYYMLITNQDHKANFDYYNKMIRIHEICDVIGMLSAIKDEDFEFLDNDDRVLSETDKELDLAFLNDCFIYPKDKRRFKKSQIFNFIRNSFFHDDEFDLYKISPNGYDIFINLMDTKPIPFQIKINVLDIYRMNLAISKHTHHAPFFQIKNEDNVNIDNLSVDADKITKMNEINKLSLIRYEYDGKATDIKNNMLTKLDDKNASVSLEKTLNILNEYGNVKEIEYQFSREQKELLYEKIENFSKYMPEDLRKFLVSIIYSCMPGGIYKIYSYNNDYLMSREYFEDPELELFSIVHTIVCDFFRLYGKNNGDNNRQGIFRFISDSKLEVKLLVLYTLDSKERINMAEEMLFRYALCSLKNDKNIEIDNVIYDLDHLRNAFTHNRYFCYTKDGEDYYYIYDDESNLADPNNANYYRYIKKETLYKIVDTIRNNYNRGLTRTRHK